MSKDQKPKKYELPYFRGQHLVIPDLYRAIQYTQKGKQWLIVCIALKTLPIDGWIQTFDCPDNQCSEQFIRYFKGNLTDIQWMKQQAAGMTMNQTNDPLVLIFELEVL